MATGTSQTTPEQTLTPNSIEGPARKLHSCVVCAQRKVKCDKLDPCSNCLKHATQCVYRDPAPPRRRKRKLSDGDLKSRVERYEKILRDLGVSFVDGEVARDSRPDPSGSAPRASTAATAATTDSSFYRKSLQDERPDQSSEQRGQLIVGNGKSRYVETPLYQTLGEELRLVNPDDLLEGSSDDEDEPEFTSPGLRKFSSFNPESLILGGGTPNVDLQSLHPPQLHVQPLWRIYVENVDPIVKIFHVPTVEKALFEASRNLDNIPKPMEALMFSIYAAAITSLDDAECREGFGDSRSALLAQYRAGVQQALHSAKFLRSSEIIVLQAYVLLLLSIRYELDPRTLWALAGVAVRNAQRLGLHKETGTHNISPFDIEMRNRLYWQVAFIDVMSAQASGCEIDMENKVPRIKPPANLNDADFYPSMKSLPPESDRPTEIIFMRLRSDFANFLPEFKAVANDASAWGSGDDEAAQEKRKKAIANFEKHLELNYLRFIDPLVPIHFLTATVARLAVTKMRLAAQQPRGLTKSRKDMSQEEKDAVFHDSLKLLEYDNAIHGNHITKRFLWHSRAHFQMGSLIAVLDDLRERTTGQDADNAWHILSLLYKYHPELTSQTKKPVFKGLGSLAIQAWTCREVDTANSNAYCTEAPAFIQELRSVISDADASFLPKALDKLATTDAHPAPADEVKAEPGAPQDCHHFAEVPSQMPPPMDQPGPDLSPIDWTVYDELMLQDYPVFPFGGGFDQPFAAAPFSRGDFQPNPYLQQGMWPPSSGS